MAGPVYGVLSRLVGESEECVVYDGTDYAEAERRALYAHRMSHGRAYVSVMLDGGSWRDVKHVPGDPSSARVTDAGFCLHPECGQIHPLSCYCAATMSVEERARWEADR